MEEEKMYTGEKGSFTVNFPNRNGLSNDEIMEIFTVFGEVKHLGCAGDEKGFRFVNFSEEESAIKAVEGMKGHPKITLVPRRPKRPGNDRNPSNRDQSRNARPGGNQGNSNWSFGSQEENKSGNNSFDNSNESNGKNDRRGNPKFGNRGDGDNERKGNFKPGNRFDNKESGDRRNFGKGGNEGQARRSRENSVSNNAQDSQNEGRKMEQSQRSPKNDNKLTRKNSFRSSSSKNQETEVKPQEEVTPEIMKPNFVADMLMAMPKLVPLDATSMPATKYNEVMLKTVIIGNLPPNYGAFYALHLLEKFNPFSIDERVYVIPGIGLRYCRAYFETEEQAFAAEKALDQLQVGDQKLIVLRAEVLSQMGKIKPPIKC